MYKTSDYIFKVPLTGTFDIIGEDNEEEDIITDLNFTDNEIEVEYKGD